MVFSSRQNDVGSLTPYRRRRRRWPLVLLSMFAFVGPDDGKRAVSHTGGTLQPVQHRTETDGTLGGRRDMHRTVTKKKEQNHDCGAVIIERGW